MSVTTRTTDASYFSPMSDVHTPRSALPPCRRCGNPSLGGVMVDMDNSAPVGRPIFTVEFWCGEHTPGTFALMSDRLYPVYRILEMQEPWRMRVQRLDRQQQEQRLKT
jgi:hypothetical protein